MLKEEKASPRKLRLLIHLTWQTQAGSLFVLCLTKETGLFSGTGLTCFVSPDGDNQPVWEQG